LIYPVALKYRYVNRYHEWTQTAKATTTYRNRLKSISYLRTFNGDKNIRAKKPTAGEPFLWFVSLWLNKEMNPVVGPGPDGFLV
jgi:hypothetical protein